MGGYIKRLSKVWGQDASDHARISMILRFEDLG
jgi:hypothetical protein